jgi:hypothetical protein
MVLRMSKYAELLHASNYISKTLLVLYLKIRNSGSQNYESSATRQPYEVPRIQVYSIKNTTTA